MVVVNILIYFGIISLVNSAPGSNFDDDDYMEFLQLYKLMKHNIQLKKTTNNIFIFPMPLLINALNNKPEKHDEDTSKVARKKGDSSSGRVDASFRDFDATSPLSKSNPVSNQKIFLPSTHRNWKLVPQTICGLGSTSDRITGGKNASLGQYPWMARVGYMNANENKSEPSFRCGGSIITNRHVVTAAHCVANLPPELTVQTVRLGEHNTDTAIDCENNRCADKVIDAKVKDVIVHENYGKPTGRNDIAILSLSTEIKFTEWVSPICLPNDDQMDLDLTNEKAEVAGWGFYDLNINKGSDLLQTAQLPIITTQPCARAFRGIQINYKKQMCVGGELGIDSCNGDSGGPLMKILAASKEPRYILLGIVSLGARFCGLTTAPAIYTRITYYMDWILEHLSR